MDLSKFFKIHKKVKKNKRNSVKNENKNETIYPNKIKINDFEYNIIIIYKDKKNASVIQREENIIFNFPKKLSKKKEDEIFSYLLKSISKKVKPPKNNFKEIIKNREFMFSNELFKLEFYKGIKYIVKDKENFVLIKIPLKSINNLEHIKKKLIKILIERYKDRIKRYVYVINNETFNYKIKEIKVKYFKSKYGHCTHDNKIALNLNIFNTKKEIRDYVIIHELAHIKEKNHSKNFWNLVQIYCKNYKKIRKELRNSPPPFFVNTKN